MAGTSATVTSATRSVSGPTVALASLISYARSRLSASVGRGKHRTYGEVTVADYLKVDLGHDDAHLADIKGMLAARA